MCSRGRPRGQGRPRGLHFWLPPAHLSTTHSGGFTLSLLKLNVKQESCEYQFLYSLWFDPTGNRTRGTASVADALSTRPLIGFEYLESVFRFLLSGIRNWQKYSTVQ